VVNPYGTGLFIAHRRGWDYINHSGATAAYRAYLLRYPQLNLSIAYLSNRSDMDLAMIRKVEDLFVPDIEVHTGHKDNSGKYTMPVSRLKSFAGWYRNEKTGEGQQLVVSNDTLRSAHFKLQPAAPMAFSAGGQQVVFNGGGFLLITAAKDTTVYDAVKAPETGEGYLKTYTGNYYSSETESKYTAIIKNGRLMLHVGAVTDLGLDPTYYDGFAIADGNGDIYFVRDANGNVIGFKISVERARNITFEKAE